MLKNYLPSQLLKKEPNETELYCEFFNDSILQIRGADNPDSLRGVDYFGVILDEWAMMKPMTWEEILRPVLTENGGFAWFLFTPKGRNHAYDYWKNSEGWKDWSRHFLNCYDSGIIPKEDLDSARREMPELLFRQEFECEFQESESIVFHKLQRCITGELAPAIPGRLYVMGIDLAKTYDWTVLTVFDTITRQLVAFERFQDIDWVEQKVRIQKLAIRYNHAYCFIDSTGVGEPIYEDLIRAGVSCEPIKFTNESKKRIIENLILSIEQRLITFPRIEALLQELQQFEYELGDKGRIFYQAPEGKHDDCVISLALGAWGLRQYINQAQVITKFEDEIADRQGRGELINPNLEVVNYRGY